MNATPFRTVHDDCRVGLSFSVAKHRWRSFQGPFAIWAILFFGDVLHGQSIDFRREVVPTLTKSGCNAGACHGAAAGRGGFRLSLLGSDPDHDYQSLVYEFEGRRVHLGRPERSLILTKPSGYLDHGGDLALPDSSQEYERLLRWITAGADRGEVSLVRELSLMATPNQPLREREAATLRLIAKYTDDTECDVTNLATWVLSDPSAIEISERPDGTFVRLLRPGMHTLAARYMNRIATIPLFAPFGEFSKPSRDADADRIESSAQSNEPSLIDVEIHRQLSKLGIPVSPPATSMEWARRVTFDLTGELASLEDLLAFNAADTPVARAAYVDRLLASEAFNDYWTLRLARLLGVHSLPNDNQCVKAYSDWLRQNIADDVGWDQMARMLLTATGDSHSHGPANFSRMVRDARDHAERIGQVFMGVQLGCANCHHHPLDRWTQEDYHGLAATFAKLDRGREVRLLPRGEVTNVRTGEPAVPRIPGVRDINAEKDPRLAFADWLIDSNNPFFARAMVNRLWQAMFGRGLVDPVHDLRETNLPTHPELLTHLERDFVDHGYKLRRTLRRLALSDTYARSSQARPENQADESFYSRAYRRPIMPEVLLDAIAEITQVPNVFESQPETTKAVQRIDPLLKDNRLDVLGRCSLTKDCSSEERRQLGLSSQLHLMNGSLINEKISAAGGRLHRLIHSGAAVEDIVKELSIRAHAVVPDAAQLAMWRRTLSDSNPEERTAKIEDYLWSLLNSRDFLENR
jgi:hypothetical protein